MKSRRVGAADEEVTGLVVGEEVTGDFVGSFVGDFEGAFVVGD